MMYYKTEKVDKGIIISRVKELEMELGKKFV